MLYEEEYEDSDYEDEDEEEAEEEEEDPIIDKEWTVANREDTHKLRPLKEPRKVQIIIDKKEKKYIELFICDLTIDQQLTLEESFVTLEQPKGRRGKKKGKQLKVNLKEYYRLAYQKSVVQTNPPNLKWKDIKYFSAKSGVFDKIKAHLPDPLSSEDDDEVKN